MEGPPSAQASAAPPSPLDVPLNTRHRLRISDALPSAHTAVRVTLLMCGCEQEGESFPFAPMRLVVKSLPQLGGEPECRQRISSCPCRVPP